MQDLDPTIHVALPAKNELGYIEHTLHCLQKQSFKGFYTWVCVNQPESYRERSDKKHICINNERTLEFLETYPLPGLKIIDRSSRGKGWDDKNQGVGIARKTIMDNIASQADDKDIILSMDADTVFGENYLRSVVELFGNNPDAMGLSNPYYHPLGKDESLNRAILRYEIYMRYYALNMRFAGTPFCFTPLGSAMAAPVWAYKKINGLTPKKSGEDFYFLQKLAKAGKILMYNNEIVYPGTRLSDRVFFGTGPAMIKGLAGHWSSYPLFNPELFDLVKETINLFPFLFEKPVATPMDSFFQEQFGCNDIFDPLRSNHREKDRFVKACHEKIDGLRILQFLKSRHNSSPGTDEDNLRFFMDRYFPDSEIISEVKNLNFSESTVDSINKIRNFLFNKELEIQKSHDYS